jgi:CubicO group peptidase (beta-lactamase class C family)
MKMSVVVLCALATLASRSVAEEYATPESQGVSSSAILSWLDACERELDCLHGFVIRRNGKIIAEGSWKPFDTLNGTHILYSHSKSFTSTAVGLLADEKKLDLDERVADLFPDDLPEGTGERLRSLRIRDLLTMNMGAKDHRLKGGGDWVKDALAKDFVSDPGTVYRYDSDATYLLAAIVEKKCGTSMMAYLDRKIFKPLGFGAVRTTYSPQGIPCGGWGMHMSTRDISKFGQLYLDEGEWRGRRILSRDWVRLATAKQTASGSGGPDRPDSDWYQGYGFQFWRCRHNAYRADGANGQCTVVIPDRDAVVSIHASLSDMAAELNLVWRHLLPAMEDAPLPENPAAAEKLAERCASLALETPGEKADGIEKFFGTYDFGGDRKIGTLSFACENGAIVCAIETRAGKSTFPVGVGEWKGGTVKIDPETYEPLGFAIGEQKVFSAVAVLPDGRLKFRVHFIDTTLKLDLVSSEKDGRVVLSGRIAGLGGSDLEGVKVL